ncbi:helix-turn-helix transcriptional regulator [Neobacillus sp. NPDC058068]|uniref:helix-turn-helix transcriptional regulator n=1 Tax=Neobacillus sp. NPDC058068 TaxID=3346325 RepID=UPI0036D8749A
MRNWLAKARKQKMLTHQKVADLAGVKRQYYGMIENGERTPSVGTAKKIAGILEVEWTLFFDEKGNKTLRKTNTA